MGTKTALSERKLLDDLQERIDECDSGIIEILITEADEIVEILEERNSERTSEALGEVSPLNTLVIVPYTEHRTECEGNRHKVHLTRLDEDGGKGALCGFDHAQFGGTLHVVDGEWLEQPDGNRLCKHCQKKAKKLLAL